MKQDKGKKSRLLLLSFVLVCALTGCNNVFGDKSDLSKEESGRMTGGEKGQEEAVNTLQIGRQDEKNIPMEELKAAVVDILGESYWPDALITPEELGEKVGISSNMYNSFLAEYQHSEAGIDMMIVVEAKEENISEVERVLNEYREWLLNTYEEQPLNRAKVFASRIEIIENYVCYVQLGADISGLQEAGEEAMVEHCQHENERAIDILEKTILADR